jgi:hypothetical protein
MSFSQFDDSPVALGLDTTLNGKIGREVPVKGPMTLDANVKQVNLSFLLVQGTVEDPRWVSGSVHMDVSSPDLPSEWAGMAVAAPGDLVAGEETRGVAVAILVKENPLSFETLTWCEKIDVIDPLGGAALASQGPAAERV